MKHVHLDSSHLIDSLEYLISAAKVGNRLSQIDTTDFLSHLVCREKIYFDGDVFGAQKDRLDRVIVQACHLIGGSAGGQGLETKLVAFQSLNDGEAEIVQRSVSKVAANAERLRSDILNFDDELEHCVHLPSADKFEESVKTLLIPQLQKIGSLEGIDAIWSDNKIAGRRFIWAGLKDDKTRTMLRGAMVGLKKPYQLFQLLFAHFRAEYAVERNQTISVQGLIKETEIFYVPSATRSCILNTAFKSPKLPEVKAEEILGQQVISSWFQLKQDSHKQEFHLPVPMRLLLAKMKVGTSLKIELLRQAVELSHSDEAKVLSQSMDSLTSSYIGSCSPDKFLSELRDDIHAEKFGKMSDIYHSPTEFSLWAGIVGAAFTATAGPIGFLPLAGGIPYLIWRFRHTRIIARKLSIVLPKALDTNDYVGRYRSVFSVDPPNNS